MPNPENIEPHKWEKGQSGNPKGFEKGVPHRSTIARKVLEMNMNPPEKILKTLHELYPALQKRLKVEEIITMIQGLKAMTDKDTQAYKALMDSAYGSPVQDINQQIKHDIDFSNIPTNELVDRLNRLLNSRKED
jgi:hypothetical protein